MDKTRKYLIRKEKERRHYGQNKEIRVQEGEREEEALWTKHENTGRREGDETLWTKQGNTGRGDRGGTLDSGQYKEIQVGERRGGTLDSIRKYREERDRRHSGQNKEIQGGKRGVYSE